MQGAKVAFFPKANVDHDEFGEAHISSTNTLSHAKAPEFVDRHIANKRKDDDPRITLLLTQVQPSYLQPRLLWAPTQSSGSERAGTLTLSQLSSGSGLSRTLRSSRQLSRSRVSCRRLRLRPSPTRQLPMLSKGACNHFKPQKMFPRRRRICPAMNKAPRTPAATIRAKAREKARPTFG